MKKNAVLVLVFGFLLSWFLLPFILVTDMYPFLRFGMYAEPPTQHVNHEIFWIELWINDQKQDFKPELLGFGNGHFQYIVRYFVYQNKKQQFFSQLFYLFKKKQKKQAQKQKCKYIIFQKITPNSTLKLPEKVNKIAEEERIL